MLIPKKKNKSRILKTKEARKKKTETQWNSVPAFGVDCAVEARQRRKAIAGNSGCGSLCEQRTMSRN